MQFVEQQRLIETPNMWDTKGQNLDHKKWAKYKGSAGFSSFFFFFAPHHEWVPKILYLSLRI